MAIEIEIRRAIPSEAADVARVFRATRNYDLPYLPNLHTPEDDLNFFRDHVFKEDQILITVDRGGACCLLCFPGGLD